MANKKTVDNNSDYREQKVAELRSLTETYIYAVIYRGKYDMYYVGAIERVFAEIHADRYNEENR